MESEVKLTAFLEQLEWRGQAGLGRGVESRMELRKQ